MSSLQPKKTADNDGWGASRIFILMIAHYPDLGNVSDCLKATYSLAARPIRSTTRIWAVTRHRYHYFYVRSSDFINPVVTLRNLCCFRKLQAHSGSLTNERCNLTRTRVPISSKSSVTRTNIGPYIVLTVGIDVTNGSWDTALVSIYGSKRKTFKNSRQSSSVALSCALACGNFLLQQVSENGGSRSRAHTRFFFTRTNILVFFPNLVSVLKFWWIPLPGWHSNPVSL